MFTPIAQAVREQFTGANVTGEYVRKPSSFPHVSIVESDNYITTNLRSSSANEQYSTVMLEVNVHSNKVGGKKSECRAILSLIDNMLYAMNFSRIAMTPVPNLDDASIYRLTARYRAVTDGTRIYRI